MKKQMFSRIQNVIDPISQYFAKKALIRQLESLSDRELEDAGILRHSIPAYVQAIYNDKKPREISKRSGDRSHFPKHFASNGCCNC